MDQRVFKISGIPAVLWGPPCSRVILAVHGSQSSKTDTPIALLAGIAAEHGYQVLSFDLPEHGERKSEPTPCTAEPCVRDLRAMMDYAQEKWAHISLFANSIGAYFCLLAYAKQPLEQAWFLSPVVDMQRLIENMMAAFQVSAERLQREQTIPTPAGQALSWDYYCYVTAHPVAGWKPQTFLLYGGRDALCEKDTILRFAQRFSCALKIIPEAEHYFHTPAQLQAFCSWLKETMESAPAL
ncbi:MAG: alpha/beta hydrolase [Oscillospiraceae bacterium]|nr:alpha/beta hydrolase [Oscillospiraceae bacterium]